MIVPIADISVLSLSFASATGYDDRFKLNHVAHDEAEIEKMKAYPPFSYILPE